MRSGGARVPTRADPGSVTRRRHRNGFCHPDRDSPTQSRPAGRELRAERRTHLAGCPGQGPGGEQPPGRLCPGAAAGAAPRSPVSGCSLRRRASRRPLSAAASRLPLTGLSLRHPPLFVYSRSPSGAPRGGDGAAEAAGGRCRRCCPLRLGGASGGGRGAAAGGGQDLNEGR